MPLPLLAIPGLISAGVGLYQQIRGGQKAKNLKRPTRQVTAGTQEGVAMTRYGAQAGQRPGSDLARERIAGTQAGAVSQVSKAGGSAASTMAAAIGAQAQANRGMQEQDVMDAQFQQQMNTQYLSQLQNLSREQAANWEWNEAQKFQEEADAARRLQESGMQNFMGGITDAAGMGFMQKMGYFNNANGGGDLGEAVGQRLGRKERRALKQTQQNYAGAQEAVSGLNIPQPYQYQMPNLMSGLNPIEPPRY